MEKDGKSSGFLTGLFCIVAGIAAGVTGKAIYDEVMKDEQAEVKHKVKDLYTKKGMNTYSDEDNLETTNETDMESEYESFFCPICLEIMKDPVITPNGISFERKAILDWLKKSSNCPITKTPLKENELITNYALKCTIDDYLKKQKLNSKTKIG